MAAPAPDQLSLSYRVRRRLQRMAGHTKHTFLPWISKSIIESSLRSRRPQEVRLLVLGEIEHYRRSVLAKVLPLLNVTATDDPQGCAAAIKWAPNSIFKIQGETKHALGNMRIINDTMFFCDKDNVADHFKKTFGYDLEIDPTLAQGRVVKKSKKNAAHDGVIIDTPVVNPDPDFSYSKLISNVIDDYVEDIRLPVIGNSLPFCYLKYRLTERRFTNANSFCQIAGIGEVFKTHEIEKIKDFLRSIQLEYGEIDILRDRADGRIYIIDANNTPFGPPNGLDEVAANVALHLLAGAFAEEFLSEIKD